MIPYLLAAVGGYLIGQSRKQDVFADGGMMAKGGGIKYSLDYYKMKLDELDPAGNIDIQYDSNKKEWYWEDYAKDTYKTGFKKQKDAFDDVLGYLEEKMKLAKGGRILVGRFDENQIRNKEDKKAVEKAQKETGLKYVDTKIIKKGGKMILEVFLIPDEEYYKSSKFEDGGMMADGGGYFEYIIWDEIIDDPNDDNEGYIYGINFIDGDSGEALDSQWFKSEEERDEFINKNGLIEYDYDSEEYAKGGMTDLEKYHNENGPYITEMELDEFFEKSVDGYKKEDFDELAYKMGYEYDEDSEQYYLHKMAKGGKVKSKKWIQEALTGDEGSLRRTAKRKGLLRGDENLSMTDLKKLQKMGGKTGKRAHLAETLRKFDDGGVMDNLSKQRNDLYDLVNAMEEDEYKNFCFEYELNPYEADEVNDFIHKSQSPRIIIEEIESGQYK
jgi:uncharacterized protein YjhX (UPF0386 family)